MKHLIILVGPPGSGKTTIAKDYEMMGYVRASEDDQKGVHLEIFNRAIVSGNDVVIDRMNFDKKQRARYIEPAKKAGYTVKIITLFVPYAVCLDRCQKREYHPTIQDTPTALSALRTFFTKYERPEETEADVLEFASWGDEPRRKCVIVDLDGTLCNIEHRLHYVRRKGKKDWRSFFKGLEEDTPNRWCLNLVYLLTTNRKIVFCSGRPSNHYAATSKWLSRYVATNYDLYLRHEGDHRKDDIAKEILLDFEVLPRYDVEMAIDDRQQVVDLWRRRGIVALQCSEGNF